MKFALATATAALLTATSAFAAGVEGQGPDLGVNTAATTGEVVSVMVDGVSSEARGYVANGGSYDVTVFEGVDSKIRSGGDYR